MSSIRKHCTSYRPLTPAIRPRSPGNIRSPGRHQMEDLRGVKELLDEINAAISSYDPVFKEQARDILLERAFGSASGPRPRRAAAPSAGRARDEGEGEEGAEEAPRRRPGRPKG